MDTAGHFHFVPYSFPLVFRIITSVSTAWWRLVIVMLCLFKPPQTCIVSNTPIGVRQLYMDVPFLYLQ